jgi:hypothetical protein
LDDQATVLADLTYALEASEAPPPDHAKRPGVASARPPGRPKGAATALGETYTEKLLSLLGTENGLSIADMADSLYETHDDAAKNKIRSLLGALKRRKLVRRVDRGKWEAAKPKK